MSTLGNIRDALYHTLVPALPTPIQTDGTIDMRSLHRYSEYMSELPIGGVALWVHTGRGLMLNEADRSSILSHWRNALPNKVIVAGAGCPTWVEAETNEQYIFGAVSMAKHAKELGADALLAYAPVRFRDLPEAERDKWTLQYHRTIAEVGLPLILFYLYEAAGGIGYSPDVLRELLRNPNVIGIKMATLDSVMTFQEVAALIKTEFPSKLLITGEDRFLGYSLMMGADAALIGMGSALTQLQCDLLQSWYTKELSAFHLLSGLIDQFSMVTFSQPMEGYIARMLYVLSRLEIIPLESAIDPFGPPVPLEDFRKIERFLALLAPEYK